MKFPKAVTTDGNIEFFNVSHIRNIRRRPCGDVCILIGAGLYWHVRPDTMVFVELDRLASECMGGVNHA